MLNSSWEVRADHLEDDTYCKSTPTDPSNASSLQSSRTTAVWSSPRSGFCWQRESDRQTTSEGGPHMMLEEEPRLEQPLITFSCPVYTRRPSSMSIHSRDSRLKTPALLSESRSPVQNTFTHSQRVFTPYKLFTEHYKKTLH